MERISIFVRTKKVEGEVKLRFRLRDGRSVDLYHKSEWRASFQLILKESVKYSGQNKENYEFYLL